MKKNFSRSLSSKAINQRLQQKQSRFVRNNRAAASAQACLSTSVLEHKCQKKLAERSIRSAASAETFEVHPKQLTSGLSTSVIQHKRQQKLVERSNRIKASAETVKLHPTQWSSGFSTSVSRSLSSEAINQRLQQKQSSFVRSNRSAASVQA